MIEEKVKDKIVCVVGIGYVGLPLAKAFSKHLRVIGVDMKDAIVVLESTVYPGVTEEVVKPILEEESGLKCGIDFKIAYSPERINPGDEEHTVERITKVVAGMDEETTELVSELYLKVAPNVYKAKDIKTAEAAKVIENIQRDLNIALMNELAIIFHKMGLDTQSVLTAAGTKWNFHPYMPGLVGGHCIPVDPYYLVYKAKELGYHPQVILAGRAINDYIPKYVAEMAIKGLNEVGKVIKGSKVLIMGLTYKENVPDTRESPVREMVKELKEFGGEVYGFDPLLDKEEIEGFGVKALDFSFSTNLFLGRKALPKELYSFLAQVLSSERKCVEVYGYDLLLSQEEIKEFGVKALDEFNEKVDCVIVAVAHDEFKQMKSEDLERIMSNKPVLIDVRGMFDGEELEERGFLYKTL